MDNDGKIENNEGYSHGETWCLENSKAGLTNKSLPGSRYFRMMCYNGEVIPEPCSEFKNEICIEEEVDDFSTAGCVLNKWEDCVTIPSKEDCENIYARNCKWVSGYSILKDEAGKDLGKDENNLSGSCVPKNAPGFDFWNAEGNGVERCSAGSSFCVVKYETNVLTSREEFGTWSSATKMAACVENCYCIPGYTDGKAKNKYENNKPDTDPKSHTAWINSMNNICYSIGDCGNKKNYLGYFGENKTALTIEFIKKP
jgi:hypothetical protein